MKEYAIEPGQRTWPRLGRTCLIWMVALYVFSVSLGVPYLRWTKPLTFDGSKQVTYIGLDGRKIFLFRPEEPPPLIVLAQARQPVLSQIWHLLVEIKQIAFD